MSRCVLPLRVRCELALGAANGLAYLHELRIVHFDLKPDNLLLDAPLAIVRAAAGCAGGDSCQQPGHAGAAAGGGAAGGGGGSSGSQDIIILQRGGSGAAAGINTSPAAVAAAAAAAAAAAGGGVLRTTSGAAGDSGAAAAAAAAPAGAAGVHGSGGGHRLLAEALADMPVVKVADFGLSKHKLNSSYVSSCRDLRGTLPYMAPELVADPERVCEKADVWSLGVVMWEMLTREIPFQVSRGVAAASKAVCWLSTCRVACCACVSLCAAFLCA
jgi:serine/threonine protein kinase